MTNKHTLFLRSIDFYVDREDDLCIEFENYDRTALKWINRAEAEQLYSMLTEWLRASPETKGAPCNGGPWMNHERCLECGAREYEDCQRRAQETQPCFRCGEHGHDSLHCWQGGTNTGHGHVRQRPDGVRARCGGPGICAECSREAAQNRGA